MVKSELDELKYSIKTNQGKTRKDLVEKFQYAQMRAGEANRQKRELEKIIQAKNKEEERLIIELAKLNQKLKEYEES